MNRERTPDVMTPEQVAEYLQLDLETVYRYLRGGQLVASKTGRNYRVTRRAVDQLLWSTQTSPDATLRGYTGAQIDAFLELDRLDESARAVLARLGVGRSAGWNNPEREASGIV